MGAYSERCAATLLGWELQYPAKSRLCIQVSDDACVSCKTECRMRHCMLPCTARIAPMPSPGRLNMTQEFGCR